MSTISNWFPVCVLLPAIIVGGLLMLGWVYTKMFLIAVVNLFKNILIALMPKPIKTLINGDHP